MLALYLSVLDDRNFEEDFTEVYNTYKRLVYHTAYKIMDDSYLAEDVLQEVFLYVAKNFSKIHRENCHELAAYLVSCSRSRAYDMLRKQREEPLEEVPDAPDDAPVPDDAAVSTDNIERLTELIGQMKPMYRDPLRLLAMGYTNRALNIFCQKALTTANAHDRITDDFERRCRTGSFQSNFPMDRPAGLRPYGQPGPLPTGGASRHY